MIKKVHFLEIGMNLCYGNLKLAVITYKALPMEMSAPM